MIEEVKTNENTNMVRCGIHKEEPYFSEAKTAKMTELAEWITDSDRVISF